jgi:type VII secretion protein EccE
MMRGSTRQQISPDRQGGSVADVRNARSSSGGASGGGWSQATVQPTTTGGGGHRRNRQGPTGPRQAATPGPALAPRFTVVQLVLLEIAAAAVVCGLAAKHGWQAVGIGIAALLLLLSIVPAQRRWLYQALGARLRLTGRKRVQRRHTGLASLAGPYEVVDVATSGGAPIAVIRAGTIWAVPLELRQDSVFNDDAGVPLGGLESLLKIEDVSLASVRLLNIVTPAVVPSSAPTGPTPQLARDATRYCVLTLDTMLAAAALADRGGSEAAITQILRRCAMRAEEVFGGARLRVETLDESTAHRVLDNCLGPSAPVSTPAAAATAESASGIRVGGTYSTTVAIGGAAGVALARLVELLPYLPGRVAATSLILSPDRRRGGAQSTLLVRVSAPADRSVGDLNGQVRKLLSQAGLPVQRVSGEQGELLRASTPLGLSEGLG